MFGHTSFVFGNKLYIQRPVGHLSQKFKEEIWVIDLGMQSIMIECIILFF